MKDKTTTNGWVVLFLKPIGHQFIAPVLDMGIPPFEFLVRDALEYLRIPQCVAIFSGSWAELSDKPILLKISYSLVRGHKEIKL